MKFYIFNITRFVVDYLGRLFGSKRQQRWIYSLLSPLSSLWTTYDLWRREKLYLINITGQVISLEGYLNDTYDAVSRRIFISPTLPGAKGVFISLEQEIQPALDLPLESEGVGVGVGVASDSSVNFTVFVPLGLQPLETPIIADVKKFKTAGKRFQIAYSS